jgi:hypothetical protein
MDEPAKRAIGAGLEYPEAVATLDGLAPELGGAQMEVAYIDEDIKRRMLAVGSVPEGAVFIARHPSNPDLCAFVLDNGEALKTY